MTKQLQNKLNTSNTNWKELLIFILDGDEALDALENMNEVGVFNPALTGEEIHALLDHITDKTRESINLPLQRV